MKFDVLATPESPKSLCLSSHRHFSQTLRLDVNSRMYFRILMFDRKNSILDPFLHEQCNSIEYSRLTSHVFPRLPPYTRPSIRSFIIIARFFFSVSLGDAKTDFTGYRKLRYRRFGWLKETPWRPISKSYKTISILTAIPSSFRIYANVSV